MASSVNRKTVSFSEDYLVAEKKLSKTSLEFQSIVNRLGVTDGSKDEALQAIETIIDELQWKTWSILDLRNLGLKKL